MKKAIISVLKNPWLTRFYLLFLLIGMVFFFYSQRDNVLTILRNSEPVMLFLALLPYFVVVGIISPYLHRTAYKEIGTTITFWQAFRIFHLSRIGNYLPGKVWFATNYYLFSKKLDVDTDKIAKNFIVINILLFMVGSICTFPIISSLTPTARKLVILFPFLMFFLLHPKVMGQILRIFIRNDTGTYYRYVFFVKISILYFLVYVLLGVALYFCAAAFTVVDPSTLYLFVSAGAASAILGLLAVFAPAGLGVREAVAATVLGLIMPLQIAITVALALRVVMMAIDFFCALISAVSLARDEKRLAYTNS